jgi:hypothetical protein
MVAKANTEGRASPVLNAPIPALRSPEPNKDVYEPWDMSEHERDLSQKCVRLILGRQGKVCTFIENQSSHSFLQP